MHGSIARRWLSVLLLSVAAQAAEVTVTSANGEHRFTAPSYEATVAADGALTSLKLAGTETLATGVNAICRGLYCHQGNTLKLTVGLPDGTKLPAQSDAAAVTYEFAPDAITCTVTNKSGASLNFFAVFKPDVTALRTEAGQYLRAPVRQEAQTSTWFAGKGKLTVRGSNTLWPWEQNTQVVQCTVGAGQTRKVVLELGAATEDELAKVAAAAPATAAPAAAPAARPAAPAVGLPPMPKPDADAITIKKAGYEAYIGKDGCLTHLRLGGVDFLRPGVDISRGLYFHQGGPVFAGTPVANGDTVEAKGEKAAIKYEFADTTITCTATNPTEKPLDLYAIPDPQVSAFQVENGSFVRPVATAEAKTTTWFSGKARLKVTGSNRLWGPWNGLQVWHAGLSPHESRTITFEIGATSEAEAAAIAKLPAYNAPQAPKPIVEEDLTVLSPRNLQVFQRRTRRDGAILLSGRVKPVCDKVEVRLTGQPLEGSLPTGWQPVKLLVGTRGFHLSLPVPAGGWYRLELRALKGGQPVATATVEKVGVGEVFVGAGQSNSTNYGQERTQQTSGMVSSFSGSDWRLADDPQPGAHDTSSGGSFWPSFGDAMYARYHVPIGVATTGHGGTSVTQWQPGSELFNWTLNRLNQLGVGGFRALLWHQGESDTGRTAEQYQELLSNTIWALKQAAGWEFPFFVAQVSYHNPDAASFPSTRTAQQRLWQAGVALEGPDTDTLGGDHRDYAGKGIHFSPKGLKAHGQMWAEKVGAYLDKVLAEGE